MQLKPVRRFLLTVLCAALLFTMAIPTYAIFGKKDVTPTLSDLTRNVVLGETLTFRAEDFSISGKGELASLTITSLPDHSSGILTVGGQAVQAGTIVRAQALGALRFQPFPASTATSATFHVTPTFSSGQQGASATINIHLLTAHNQAPIAENLSLKTYRNVAISGQFQAKDADGDKLTFQLTASPARGSVTIREDGSGGFVYTPYENKTGKDAFTYVAVDQAGNLSNPAKVTIRIEKANTAVTYADMDGHPAHHAAIQLAEEGLLVGERVNDLYFFSPDTTVTRSQFLALAMSAAEQEPLEQVSLTGFSDDSSIPTWAKGYVSSALLTGAVSGMRDSVGRAVFCPQQTITRAEAVAILDELFGVSDVAVQTWSAVGISHSVQDHWAMQSAADLACAGVLRLEDSTPEQLDAPLTRSDTASLLANCLTLKNSRKTGWF